ncbi:MAG: CdaR family protein [Tissierellia bacterium]|nr:CdaR family protein [Tissierellia bacterium]
MQKNKTRNLTAKIVSLVVAILLWSYVMGVENPSEYRTVRNIKVNFLHLDTMERRGLELMNPTDTFVNVRISGKKMDLEKLSHDSISATVDLEGYSAGEVRIPINIRLNNAPEKLEVVSQSPSDIVVYIDRIITKEMDVKIVTNGNPEENFILGDLESATPKVSVKGPSSAINQVKRMEAYVDINGRTQAFTVSVPVYAVDDLGQEIPGVDFTPSTVDVTVPIYRTAIIPIELVMEGKLPTNYEITNMEITPPTVALKLIQEGEIPPKITTEPINVEKLINRKEKKLNLIIPDGFATVDNKKEYYLHFDIHEYVQKSVIINRRQIMYYNIPEGLRVDEDNLPDSYEIILRGYKPSLENIQAGNLRFDVNLVDAIEGRNAVHLNVKSSEFPELSIPEASTIEIVMVPIEKEESMEQEE